MSELRRAAGPLPKVIRRLKKYGREVASRLVFNSFIKASLKKKIENRLQHPISNNHLNSYFNYTRHQSMFEYEDDRSTYSKSSSIGVKDNNLKSAENNKIVVGQAFDSMQTTGHSIPAAYYSIIHV